MMRPEVDQSHAKWYFGVNAIFLNSFASSFVTTPATLAFAKCVPSGVEGVMLGLIGSIMRTNTDIIMRLVALMFMINSGVDEFNPTNLWQRMFYASFLQLGCILLVKFVIDRHEF